MKNVTKKLSGVTLGLMMVGAVHADTFNATATVSSAITLVETTALDLGTLFIPAQVAGCTGNGNVASFFTVTTTGAAGAVTAGTGNCTANMVSLATDTAGLITITGAAAFGTVTVDSSATPTDLIHSSGNPALPKIIFTTLVTAPTDGNTVTLDANGDGPIIVGGTFSMEDGANNTTAYADGVYTGTYDIDVTY